MTHSEIKSMAAVYNVDYHVVMRQIPMLLQHTRVTYEKDPNFPDYVPYPITDDHIIFLTEEALIDAIQKEAYRQWKES